MFFTSLVAFVFSPMAGVPLILYNFGYNYFNNQKRSDYKKLMMFLLPFGTSLTILFFIFADWEGMPVYHIVHFVGLIWIQCFMLAHQLTIVHPDVYDILNCIDFDEYPELDVNSKDRQTELISEIKF